MATNKALGQHWLRNRGILDTIARITVQTPFDEPTCPTEDSPMWWEYDDAPAESDLKVCLEIGPGLGTLTSALLRQFPKVIAVEYDKELARKLPGSFPGKDLTVVNEDFLKFDLSQVPAPYVVAGNIPYYITSPIIEKLLTAENVPRRVVLLMQKEVAERIGDEDMGSLLSLKCHNLASIRLGPVVPKEEFEPAPKVDSQVVLFEPYRGWLHPGEREDYWIKLNEQAIKLAEKGFSQPRKKLVHNLAGVKMEWMPRSYSKDELKAMFAENGLDADGRPGDFGVYGWQKIYDLMKK